jgi:hypothetical protein
VIRVACLALLLIAGCGRPAQEPDAALCECFADAAFAAVKAKNSPAPSPEEKCCGKCGGTGRVRSGDNQSWVACPCPDSCPCKQGKP